MTEQDLLEESILPLISTLNNDYDELSGTHKVALLKTVAAHFENLTVAQATTEMFRQSFTKL